MRLIGSLGVVVSLMWTGVATAQPAEPDFSAEQRLILQHKEEQAIEMLEARAAKGECPAAWCEAMHARALSRLSRADQAAVQAQKAVDKIEEKPQLGFRDANELGAILFRAPKRQARQLQTAVTAFRFAKSRYTGRASNIAYNLATALRELGETAEAQAVEKEFATGILVDQTLAILGDFQSIAVEHR